MNHSLPERGLFWIQRTSEEKGVQDHAIIDLGNVFQLPQAQWAAWPIVVHLTMPRLASARGLAARR
jgi:hypothetical protein